uniref:Uncharacterized protein n=1 Tax=Romanomermis culicivorax TaxID=13658 RepID=A0A915JDJ6_ROMCU
MIIYNIFAVILFIPIVQYRQCITCGRQGPPGNCSNFLAISTNMEYNFPPEPTADVTNRLRQIDLRDAFHHQIKFSELGPETKMMTNQEYSLLKDLIKDKHNIAIDQLDMKYKQYGAGPVKDKQCWQMNIKHEMNIQVRDGTTLNGHIKMRMEHKLLDEEEISVKLFKKLELEFIEVRELKIGWRIATVGRCLPTLGFTAFSAYQLHQEIKNNDTVSAAITGASLAIDIIGCGFEAAAAVGLLAISPIIVKIGLIVSTALAIAQNIYSGFRQTQQIGEVIPLTLSEKYYSFKRSVIPWLDADPTLKSMADQVVANEQAVATAFHMFPEVNRFLLAAATRVDDETGLVSYHENNTMDMTKRKHKVQVSRAMPRQEQIGTDYSLFCAMDEKHVVGREELKQKMSWSSMATFGFPEIVMAIINHLTTEKRPQVDDYRCVNAFGVNRVNSSSSDTTIFLLYNGADDVVGFPDSPNVMILGNGKKKIYGGQKDDHFVMNGIHTYGYLDGGSGEDVIDFMCDAENATVIYMVTRDTLNLLDIPVGSHHFIFNLVTLPELHATMNDTSLTLLIGSTGQLDIEASEAADLKFTFNAEKITMTINQDAALLENQEKKCVILTFIEFYVFKQKYETLILIFENRKISLSSEFVKTAVDMSLMWGRMDERLENVEQEEKEESDFEEYVKGMDELEKFFTLRQT